MRGLYRSLAAALLLAVAAGAGCAGAPDRPSMLLVVGQGVRPDHLSAYGYQRQTTPALESLAAESVVFEHAYASTPDPVSAMASLLTGRYPSEHGLMLRPVLDPSVLTLPEHLSASGYQVHLVASDPSLEGVEGLLRGFESIEMVDPTEAAELDGGAAEVTRRALAWLREIRDPGRPFLLVVIYSSTTLPFDPPEPFDARFTEEWMSDEVLDRASTLWIPLAMRINSGEIVPGVADWDVIAALYDGELAYLDEQLRGLVDGMRDEGLLESTHLVLTADRGEDLGAGNRLSDPSSLSEPSLRVPLIIRKAGPAPEGRRAAGIVQDVDLAPTICELLGVAAPASVSRLAVSHAALDGGPRRTIAVSVAARQVGPRVFDLAFSLRDERYRFLLGPGGPLSLLDLDVDDPGLEMIQSSPDLVGRMQDQIASWTGMLAPPPGSTVRPLPAGEAGQP